VGLVDPSGSLAEVYRYDGYGQDLADTPQVGRDAGARNPFRFRGALNLGTGTAPLYEMGARLYAPSMAAWTSLDTYPGSAQDPASMNRFLYVSGNPTSLIDPTGHKAEPPCRQGPACPSPEAQKAAYEQARRTRATATDTGRRGCSATGDCAGTTLPVAPDLPTVERLQAWWRTASVDERNQLYATVYGRELSWLRLEQDAIPLYMACLGWDSADYGDCGIHRFTQFMEESGASPTVMVAAAYGFRGLASPSARTGALEGDVTAGFWRSGTGRYVADTVAPVAGGGHRAVTPYAAVNAGPGSAGSPSQLAGGRAFEAQQLAELGLAKNNGVWRPSVSEMGSAAFDVIVGKPKLTVKGKPVGAITDTAALEIKGGWSPLDSSYQLRLMTYHSLIKQEPLTIITTRPLNPAFADYLSRWGVTVRTPVSGQ
jgi:RHS repeat-associated protein